MRKVAKSFRYARTSLRSQCGVEVRRKKTEGKSEEQARGGGGNDGDDSRQGEDSRGREAGLQAGHTGNVETDNSLEITLSDDFILK